MKTRFVAYDRLGAKRGVLPHVLSAEIVPTKNDLPTLILSYNRNVPTHAYLQNEPEVAFEYFSGGKWVEPPNARLRLFTVDLDYLDEVPVRNYSFIGVGEGVKSVFVYGANGLPRNDDGKVQFVATNPGSMLSHVWDQAVKRGWKGFSKSFNGATDSAGRAWPTKLNLSFDDETSFQGMLDYFARLGMIDFNWTGRTLNVYVADTALARDLTTGNDPMRFNLSGGRAGIDSAPESNDMESKASHVIVIGEEGRRWEFPTGAVVAEGRREIFLSYSGVDDEGTARILAAPTIARYSNTRKNTTRQFRITEKTIAFPFIDYTVGDWCLIEKDDAEWERVQIFQMSLLIDSAGVQGYVSLGDKIDSLIERLDEAVQRIQGGSISEGNKKPTEPSGLTPSAPTGLLVTAQTFWNTNRELMSVVALSWSHDGKDIMGDSSAIVSNYYVEVQQPSWVTKDSLDTWYTLGIVGAGDQFFTHTGLPVKDRWNRYASYNFRVRAESSRKKMSAPSSVTNLVMPSDKEAPKKPATPTVTASMGVFTITTDHKASDGSAQPNDYSHSTVEMAGSPTGPWKECGSIAPPATTLMVGGESYGTRWFRLTPVDMDGNRGEWSAIASATTKQLVDTDLILSEIDAAKTVIKNAGKILVKEGSSLSDALTQNETAIANANKALTGPGGLTERLAGVDAKLRDAGQLIFTDGKTLQVKLGEANTAIGNVSTQVDTLKNTTIPKLNTDLTAATGRLTTAEGSITTAQSAINKAQGDITAAMGKITPLETGLNTLNSSTIPALTVSINGKTTINRQTTAAANPNNYSLGDRWERWDKLTAGGKLLQTWRHNGTAWIEEILSATYLPQVDIGTGTFGNLTGGRIETSSITTKQLLVGSFSNLLENGSFEFGNKTWQFLIDGFNFEATGGRQSPGVLRATGFTGRILGPGSAGITIEAGDSYRVSGWVKSPTPGNRAEICFYWYDANDKFVSNVNFNIDDATAEWKQYKFVFAPPATAVILRVRVNARLAAVTDEILFDDLALVKATDGSLIVENTIKAEHVDAESVAAKIGNFLTVNVEDLVSTKTAKLNDVVAQKIAAGTASFQTVDAKNIFVTGTTSLNEAVAKRLAVEVGTFVQLGVEQLTVTGNAKLKDATAERLFADIFTSNKITTAQMMIASLDNMLENPSFEMGYTGWGKTTNWDIISDGRNGGKAMRLTGVTVRTFGPTSGNIPIYENNTYRLSGWVRHVSMVKTQGEICWYWYTANGTFISNQNINITEADYDWKYFSDQRTAPVGAAFLRVRINATLTNVAFSYDFDDLAVTLASDGSLIVQNSITAREINAESVGAAVGSFVKADIGNLTVTGNTNLSTAVADRIFTNVFSTRKLYAESVVVGQMNNILMDPNFDDPEMLKRRNDADAATKVVLSSSNDLTVTPGTAASSFYPIGAGITDYKKWIAVKPGEVWRFAVTIASAKTAFTMSWQGRTADGGTVSVGTTTPIAVGNGTYEMVIEVPETVAWLAPSMRMPAGAGVFYIKRGTMTMSQVITPELIVDGAITTKKLKVTEDMTVELLKAHKINAAEINTNSLTADTGFIGSLRTKVLTTNSITADMITSDAITVKHTLIGPTIKTAATGARTEMTNQGIRVLSSSGVEQVKLGYGLSTGIAVLNPFTNTMLPLQEHVFGTTLLDGTWQMANDTAGSPYNNTAIRPLRSYAGGPAMTFVARSTRMLLMISLEMGAWVTPAQGLKKDGPEAMPAQANIFIRGVGNPDPVIQLNVLAATVPIPYQMVTKFTNTYMRVIDQCIVGHTYSIEGRFTNLDNRTTGSVILWGDGTVLAMPI